MNWIVSLIHKIVPEKHRPLTSLLTTIAFAILPIYLVSRENHLITSVLLGFALFIGFIPTLDDFKMDDAEGNLLLIFHNVTSALLIAGHFTFGYVSFFFNAVAGCFIFALIMVCLDHLEAKETSIASS